MSTPTFTPTPTNTPTPTPTNTPAPTPTSTPPPSPLAAVFVGSPVLGTAPLTVTLTNQSIPTRTITSYLWDFGDGVTSTLQHPVHAYTDVGAYTVQLTANTERHSDTETKAGYVTVVPTSAVVITYTYDGLYRLTNANYSGAYTYTFDYAYDAAGNRTAMTRTITSTLVTTYTYDAANRLATQNGQSIFAWDANGNLLQDGSTVYAYDFANRLISTTLSGVTTQFAYNGDGVRLRLIEAGTLTTYTQDYAAPLPVVLQAKTGTASTQYVYSLGTRPVAEYEAAAWEYLLADALGSVRQLADPSGNVTLLKSYEPYGSVLNSQGTAASIFGYSGEQMDTYIKLVFLRARYYSPDTARFLSKDTWQGDYTRPLSFNGWNYAEGNPINSTDRSGLSPNVDCSQWFLFQDLCKKSNGPDDDPSVLIARESLFENIAAAGLLRGQVKFGWDYTTSGYTWAALLLMHFLDGNGSDYNISFNSGDPFVNDPGITRATRTFGDPAIRDEADFIVPLLHDFLGNYVQPVAVSGGSSFSVGPISLQGASHYINDPSKTLGLEPRARDQGFWAAFGHVTIDGSFTASGSESCRWSDYYLINYKADYFIKDRYEWFRGKETPFPFGHGGSTVYIPHEWEISLVDAERAAEFNVNISWTEEDRLLVSHDFTQYRSAVWWDW